MYMLKYQLLIISFKTLLKFNLEIDTKLGIKSDKTIKKIKFINENRRKLV